MNPEENSIELIDRYLSGGLSVEEKYDFEERLRIDKEFREKFNIQKVSYKIIIIQSLLDLKEKMQKDMCGNTYKIKMSCYNLNQHDEKKQTFKWYSVIGIIGIAFLFQCTIWYGKTQQRSCFCSLR